MKKIFLFVSIIGIFMLASCDDNNPNYSTSNYNQTTNEETINTVSSTETASDTPTTTENNDEEITSKNVYDDDIDWGPFH